jgi:hypothetical protein
MSTDLAREQRDRDLQELERLMNRERDWQEWEILLEENGRTDRLLKEAGVREKDYFKQISIGPTFSLWDIVQLWRKSQEEKLAGDPHNPDLIRSLAKGSQPMLARIESRVIDAVSDIMKETILYALEDEEDIHLPALKAQEQRRKEPRS